MGLINEKDEFESLYADSAYTGESLHKQLINKKVCLEIHEKGYKNHPLTESQKATNKEKSRVRVRVEHVFGFMETSMGGMTLKNIGIKRVSACIGLMNLVYNMFRKVQLVG